jgi:hypothetical protein
MLEWPAGDSAEDEATAIHFGSDVTTCCIARGIVHMSGPRPQAGSDNPWKLHVLADGRG